MKTKSVAALWEVRLRKLYAGLEFKLVLLARSDRFLHSLRVMGSIAEDLRLILIAYLWNPGSNPDSNATLQPNALVKLLMLPFRLARVGLAGWGLPGSAVERTFSKLPAVVFSRLKIGKTNIREIIIPNDLAELMVTH